MRKSKLFIALLRISVGWLFLYQGVLAIQSSGWSVSEYIRDAKTFPEFYSVISSSQVLLQYATYAAKGIFIVAGILLILGIGVRIASFLGILLMAFFYFAILNFPRVGTSYYIVDEHLIYIIILLYLLVFSKKKESIGLGSMFRSSRY